MSDSFQFSESNGFALAVIGGLPIAVIDREASAQLMIRAALATRGNAEPALFITSANGQVISDCARDPQLREQFLSADLIHADGMPLVFASRFKGRHHLPERVATTDLFHDVARLAESTGASFYLLGASAEVMEHTVARVRAAYPRLNIVGSRNGYMSPDEEGAAIDEINAAAPDILWIGMGVPREIFFSTRHRGQLTNVGLIKTAGACSTSSPARTRALPGGCRRPALSGSTGWRWSRSASFRATRAPTYTPRICSSSRRLRR